MEFLMERGEVSRKDGIAVIKDAFICFSGGYTFSGKKGEPYKTDSVNNYALRTLIQAVAMSYEAYTKQKKRRTEFAISACIYVCAGRNYSLFL